ncbi:MAG: hypothetical protein NTW87_18950 [Planctomycetota bacterium]|nr:hypothetical protein [Planctomycetota bacterium]
MHLLSLPDAVFVHKWAKRYATDVDDDKEYAVLLGYCQAQLRRDMVLTHVTHGLILDILDWKSRMAWFRLRFSRESLRNVSDAIEDAYQMSGDTERLTRLTDVYGIGVPIASTFLHFLSPEHYPIIDVRVTRALRSLGYPKFSPASKAAYTPYAALLRAIANRISRRKGALRKVDMALFAYDVKRNGPIAR